MSPSQTPHRLLRVPRPPFGDGHSGPRVDERGHAREPAWASGMVTSLPVDVCGARLHLGPHPCDEIAGEAWNALVKRQSTVGPEQWLCQGLYPEMWITAGRRLTTPGVACTPGVFPSRNPCGPYPGRCWSAAGLGGEPPSDPHRASACARERPSTVVLPLPGDPGSYVRCLSRCRWRRYGASLFTPSPFRGLCLRRSVRDGVRHGLWPATNVHPATPVRSPKWSWNATAPACSTVS